MVRRGPKTSEAVRVAEGLPTCPSYLDTEAAREWRRILPLLHQMHGVGRVDRAVIAVYCTSYSDVKRLEAELRNNGETYTTHNGMQHIRPEVEILSKARGRLLQSAAALGMSPVSRKRLPGKQPDDGNDNDEWLAKRAGSKK
jgi:P27 family predicted phage terminase small subunit